MYVGLSVDCLRNNLRKTEHIFVKLDIGGILMKKSCWRIAVSITLYITDDLQEKLRAFAPHLCQKNAKYIYEHKLLRTDFWRKM